MRYIVVQIVIYNLVVFEYCSVNYDSDHFSLNSPLHGTVVDKYAFEKQSTLPRTYYIFQ